MRLYVAQQKRFGKFLRVMEGQREIPIRIPQLEQREPCVLGWRTQVAPRGDCIGGGAVLLSRRSGTMSSGLPGMMPELMKRMSG